MRLVYVYADSDGEMNCSKFCCFFPAKAINKLPEHHADVIYINQFMENSPETQELCLKADLIIIERN